MFELNGWFKLVKMNRKSKARYVQGLNAGDIVKFSMDLRRTDGASRGNYALVIKVYKYLHGDPFDEKAYEYINNATQNELFSGFDVNLAEKSWQKDPVFCVEQIKQEDLTEIVESDSVQDATTNKIWDVIDEIEEGETVSSLTEKLIAVLQDNGKKTE